MGTEPRLLWTEELVKDKNAGTEYRQVFKDVCCKWKGGGKDSRQGQEQVQGFL